MVTAIGQVPMSARRRLLALALWALASTAWGQDLSAITPQALSERLGGANPPQVLDTRGRAAYLEGSIPGARDAGRDPAGFLPDSKGGEAVLILAPGADPAPWGKRLAGFGYRVQTLGSGMAGWRAAGLPVASSETSFARPGAVPFIVPRGQCEMGTPNQSFR